MVFALPSRISAQSFIIVDSRVNIVLCNSQRYAAEILVDIKLAVLDIAQPRHIQTALQRWFHARQYMEADEAFLLNDAFIQRSERFNNLQQITNLQYNMVLDFADRMSSIRQGEKPTQLTISISNYVRRHFSEKICVENIARELFMSRPYLSAKFSREAGISLTDFILKQKTKEAKRLLCCSDKSAAAISSYLGFSSQSHFSRVFRKYSGKTPAGYRDKYQR